jgi:NADH dehydrogenase
VEVLTGRPVTDISAGRIRIGDEELAAGTVLWAAGVRASPGADWLNAPHDRAGRVEVGEDLRLPSDPSVFVIGDTAAASSQGRPVPGLAPAAKQMGRHVARSLIADLRGRPGPGPFRYRHQGDLATIGRGAAVVKLGRLELTGWPGWLFWSLVHVYFLIGARNRIAVAFSWAWDYLTFGRKARLILHPPAAGPV